MLLKYLVASFIILCATCCPEDDYDCATVLCAGPPVIVIEAIANGENVFDNQTYTLEDITIDGVNSDDIVLSIDENSNSSGSLLLLENANWIVGSNDFVLNFSNEFLVTLQVQIAQTGSDKCCGNIPILDGLQINDMDQERSNGFYTIILE